MSLVAAQAWGDDRPDHGYRPAQILTSAVVPGLDPGMTGGRRGGSAPRRRPEVPHAVAEPLA